MSTSPIKIIIIFAQFDLFDLKHLPLGLPNYSIFDSEFLYHKIDSMYEILRSLSAGDGGRGGLNLQIIKDIKLSLPSIQEQQKIATCLSSLDALITSQAEKIEQLKMHKKGLMQGLFPKIKE